MNYSVKAKMTANKTAGKTRVIKIRSKKVIFNFLSLGFINKGTINYSPFTKGSRGNLLVPMKPMKGLPGQFWPSAKVMPNFRTPSEGLTRSLACDDGLRGLASSRGNR